MWVFAFILTQRLHLKLIISVLTRLCVDFMFCLQHIEITMVFETLILCVRGLSCIQMTVISRSLWISKTSDLKNFFVNYVLELVLLEELVHDIFAELHLQLLSICTASISTLFLLDPLRFALISKLALVPR